MPIITFLSALVATLVAILFLLIISADSSSHPQFWDLAPLSLILIIYGIATRFIIPSFGFRSIRDRFMRFIPRDDRYGPMIEELTSIVERRFPDGSPLEENCVRVWTFLACRSIYRYTRDAITGSLACAILFSFLISRHRTPIYFFIFWAIHVLDFMNNNQP